jgi:hypothetical protein
MSRLSACPRASTLAEPIAKAAFMGHTLPARSTVGNIAFAVMPSFATSFTKPLVNPMRHIKLKRACRGANVPCGLLRRFEVGGDHSASFCQCQCDRLTDALAGAGDQRYAPLVCSY